jgi:hypothetical protein
MIKKPNLSRVFSLSLLAGGIMLVGGLTDAAAQQIKGGRDPFEKPGYARPKPTVTVKVGKDGKPIPVEDFSVPSIEQRIDYYKRLRASAATSGAPLPKVTSVLTINEMALIGIFKTPRGYAAMVEASPIKLSYTIYPGEKFFDGQLVAVEDNQLVFRKVTKTGKNKFVSSVQNMQLRKYTERQELEGTAPSQSQAVASREAPSSTPSDKPTVPVKIVSPLDEMNTQPAESNDKNSKAPAKKIAKVARNK